MTDGKLVILMAEDDEHDVLATRRAWEKHHIENPLVVVRDGEECLDYLYRRGKYADKELSPTPKLLLLDLNMPRINGLEVLATIRDDDDFKRLSIVVLTTSDSEPDLKMCYDMGVNAYIVKPVGFENFAEAIKDINMFWKLVTYP